MADSGNWSTPFTTTIAGTNNGIYDFTNFDVTKTPFYQNAKNYYADPPSTAPGSNKKTFTNRNNSKTINLAFIEDPVKSASQGGIANETAFKNGFTSGYLLGYNDGVSSTAQYVIVMENTFNLVDATNNPTNANAVVIKYMYDIKDLCDNPNMNYTTMDTYNDRDFKRGFYGIFNGYFQGFLDGVHSNSSGTNKDFARLSNLKDTICGTPGATSLCNSITTTWQGYISGSTPMPTTSNPSDPKSIQSQITSFQTQLNTITGTNLSSMQKTDYAALYLETLSKLYKAVKSQNDTTLKELQSNLDVFSADDQKVYYQTQQLMSTSYLNMILLVLYYLLFLVVTYFIVYVDTKMDRRGKWLLVLFFLLYPFLVNPICIYLYEAFLYFYALTNVNVYSPGTY
jgi:uncharacterized membrane protein (DUF106 family)